MHAQVAGPFDRREVALLIVGIDAAQKRIEQRAAGPLARGDAQLAQIGRLKADVGQRGHACQSALGPIGQGLRLNRPSAQLAIAHGLEPGVFVGCEDAVGPARLGQQLLALEHHMVLEAVQGDT